MRKVRSTILIILFIAALLAGILCIGMWYFRENYVVFEGEPLERDVQVLNVAGSPLNSPETLGELTQLRQLDVRDTGITVSQYETLRKKLPDCDILWNVPFQGSFYAEDTEELTVTSLTEEEIAVLDYFPELERVNARSCTDYAQLLALQAAYPECQVFYEVPVHGEAFPADTTAMTLTGADPEALLELLKYLPQLETVNLTSPAGDAEDLLRLPEQYPDIRFTWEKEFLGLRITSEDTEVDFSGIPLESVDAVADAMAYFPNVEQVIMCGCGIDNETMAAFRESKREKYKVVWSVQCGDMTLRTDDIYFMPLKYGKYMSDSLCYDLRYCEDMIGIDLGHRKVSNIEWVQFMPHLKYLVLADTNVVDISPLSGCKELVFCELFHTNITDYTPLLGCTALEDLNLGFTYGSPEPVTQMTWLKRLWWGNCNRSTQKLLAQTLPDVQVYFGVGSATGGEWRKGQHYYDMRDLMGVEYMTG